MDKCKDILQIIDFWPENGKGINDPNEIEINPQKYFG
jgi:hypothetical protein